MIKLYLRAFWAFFRALFQPIDLIEKSCPKGHSMLLGWDQCPDCHWIDKSHQFQAIRTQLPTRLLLYCFQGTHQGEVFHLKGLEETIGCSVNHSTVLTMERAQNAPTFKARFSTVNLLLSESQQPFLINGLETWKERLMDFDEIQVLNNRFLVFDFLTWKNWPKEISKEITQELPTGELQRSSHAIE